jgi:hypothetical protein
VERRCGSSGRALVAGVPLWRPELVVGTAIRPDLAGGSNGWNHGRRAGCWCPMAVNGEVCGSVVPLPFTTGGGAGDGGVSDGGSVSSEVAARGKRQHRRSSVVLVVGRGCGARRWKVYDISVCLCSSINDLLNEGCDMRRGPVLKVTLVGCGVVCRLQPPWQRVQQRAKGDVQGGWLRWPSLVSYSFLVVHGGLSGSKSNSVLGRLAAAL